MQQHADFAACSSWSPPRLALTRACAVAEYNDERAWVQLLMLPKAVLCAPPRGGRKHSRAAAAFTLERAFESNTCTMREAMGVGLASLTSSLL